MTNSIKNTALTLCVTLLLLATLPTRAEAHIIQKKACSGLVCSFDNTVKAGDLLIVIGDGGCDTSKNTCNTVSDDLGNQWKIAEIVPDDNGTILWYAISSSAGADTIYRSVGFSGTIVAEYPPALGLDGASHGTYSYQNLGDAPQGGSSDIGHTEPIEVTYPRDLIIAWARAGSLGHNYTAGPFFCLEGAIPDGSVAFEDMIAPKLGLYIGTMGWDTYAHWTMGVAAFRMGEIPEVQNPSFEDVAGSLTPSAQGPWNYGPIPGWTLSGIVGLWQPAPGTMPIPDGKTVVWMDGGKMWQDLGITSAKTYKLSVSVGNRSDNASAAWSISLYAGPTPLCTTGGSLLAIPRNTFSTQTLICNVPAGNLTIYLEIHDLGALDNVILTATEP